jgi:hypothetical protein
MCRAKFVQLRLIQMLEEQKVEAGLEPTITQYVVLCVLYVSEI